jgi:NurA-like 5'-3' nuclease
MSAKRQLDIDEQKARVVQAVKGLNIFPLEYLYKNYYQLNEEEIDEIKDKLEEQSQDPIMGAVAAGMPPGQPMMPGAPGGAPGMGAPPGAGPGPMEAGGQEGAENTPPTAMEEVDYSELKKLMLSEGLSEEAIKIVEEMSLDSKLNKI